MGNEEVRIAVADAGPLIHLSEIGGHTLLHVFNAIHIPHAVWLETGKHSKNISENIRLTSHNLPKAQVSGFVNEEGLEKLHSGEMECLYLCKQLNLSILLTDDLAVRNAAKSLQITPVGSLGIVIKAYKNDKITLAEAECYINDLYDISSLFVTRTIVELVIKELHKKI